MMALQEMAVLNGFNADYGFVFLIGLWIIFFLFLLLYYFSTFLLEFYVYYGINRDKTTSQVFEIH